jgi:hypothetical protein
MEQFVGQLKMSTSDTNQKGLERVERRSETGGRLVEAPIRERHAAGVEDQLELRVLDNRPRLMSSSNLPE